MRGIRCVNIAPKCECSCWKQNILLNAIISVSKLQCMRRTNPMESLTNVNMNMIALTVTRRIRISLVSSLVRLLILCAFFRLLLGTSARMARMETKELLLLKLLLLYYVRYNTFIVCTARFIQFGFEVYSSLSPFVYSLLDLKWNAHVISHLTLIVLAFR